MSNILNLNTEVLWQKTGEDISKAITRVIRPLTITFFVIVCIFAKAEVYEHRYFDAKFPDMDPEHFDITEKDYVEKITYQIDSVTLKIAVFPLSLNTSNPGLIVHELGYSLTNSENATAVTIDGRCAIKIADTYCEPNATPTYTNFYLLSNGEITLGLCETGIDWWPDNIYLKINDKPSRTLSERTDDFENFFNMVLSDPGSKIMITQEDEHIKIDLMDRHPSSKEYGQREAMLSVYRLINMFTIFEEYANLGYTISIKISDGEGDVICDNTFSHEEYASWNDATFTEEAIEIIDAEDEECVAKAAISIEPVNEFIGIAYDGERYALYDMERQKYLTEMSYLSLNLSDEGNTDFGYAYLFKCIKHDGSEGEVTVINGPNYTIAITEDQ